VPQLVVLDPGHGGKDPGAVSHGLKEKDLVLEICRRARVALERDFDVQVAMTRTDDTFVELADRAKFANTRNAAAFVSVHINSAANAAARGFETYRHTGAGTGSASGRLQAIVHAAVLEAMRPRGVVDRKEKSANFAVIRLTRMPAILTENLFVSNRDDAALLRDDGFISAVAESHARGIARALQLPVKDAGDIHRVTADGVGVGSFADDQRVGRAVVEAIRNGAKRVVVEEIGSDV
jgi:N-acetylmuramoyl-L-alanine amidase